MKGYIMIMVLLYFCPESISQFDYLRLSPSQKIEQRVALTDVIIEFSRPQVREREIFGGLVPYGELWRTGANKNTKITFSDRVRIGNQEIDKGSYSLFTKPGINQWGIYFYKALDQYGVPDEIDSSKLIFLSNVPTLKTLQKEETLVINLYNLTDNVAELGISWDKTQVRIPIHFYTHEVMEAKIERAKYEGRIHLEIAAAYYNDRDIELEKAKGLIESAIELNSKASPSSYNVYGIILYKLGEKENAIKAIEYSLKLAKEQKYLITIKENEKLLEEWKAADKN